VAVYRGELATTLPAGIPSQAAMAARDTLGGAVSVAQQLPADVGAAVLAAAREAFTLGLQLTTAISAVVAIGIAVLATVLLRGVHAPSEAEPTEPETVVQAEEPVQLIRSGGGCVACPGEQRPAAAEVRAP
jgi:DHA2 family multidrug resistance protein-like MFS transporter